MLSSKFPKHPLKEGPLYRDNRLLMGTFWEVTSPNRQAAAIVFSEASRIEQLLSKYIPTSEVAQLNRLGRLKVSPDTFYIIKKSQEFSRLSQGAFDITVAPLVDLWGFTNKEFRIPDSARIQAVLRLVGNDKIILHENDNVVEFRLQGTQIDLGGIAKGFALDCAVKKLKENNINSCLINAGGQIFCLGDRSGQPWKIAIRSARKAEISGTLELKNQSASTSGDYQQYFLVKNKRYCHIIDPQTGYPAQTGISSVTVVADNGLEADAFSTAVFVLGKQKAQNLAKKFENLKIIITE
ncbi:MAG TPA: FAD:protein FMN transferase [Candidatus Omnitrophota bacterium]|nr:FAD:protein FMN transferase [Candidatus Omnitrophota bacterium]